MFSTKMLRRAATAAGLLSIFAFATTPALANHGPGTSGGGSSTISGETLPSGKFDLSVRTDYTKFENISRDGAERRAATAGEFDALESAFITTLGGAYGITDELQLSGSIGYYAGNNFIDAEHDSGTGETESAIADPEGLTDLTLSAKYRVMHGKPGNLSVIAGAILPTGRSDVRLSNAERLEPSSQPGTGEWGIQAGVGYSRFLTSRVTIDTSALYTTRIKNNDFKVGDRVDLGVAMAYQFTESIKHFPNQSAFIELTAVWIGKDEGAGSSNPNSGGWTAYVTPGYRVRFTENWAFTIAPSFPFYQDLNGDQIESRFKLATTLSFSF